MESVDTQITELTDAVARGRITLAEVAGIHPAELDTLFELACERLDTGRDGDAAQMLAGLVTLFPFRARYWRAYGIALHRLLLLQRAKAAYDAAWMLDPQSLVTLCYRGEVLLYLRDNEAARQDLEAVAAGPRLDLSRRATDLLGLLDAPHWRPPAPAPTSPQRQPVQRSGFGFALRDGRSLPLDEGRFCGPEPSIDASPLRTDTTARARAFASAVATPGGTVLELADDHGHRDITETAIVRRRRTPRQRPVTAPEDERTATAVVPRGSRHRGDATQASSAAERTDIAVIPRGAGSARSHDASRQRDITEVTRTAVVLRREGFSLLEGFGALDEPTVPRIEPGSAGTEDPENAGQNAGPGPGRTGNK